MNDHDHGNHDRDETKGRGARLPKSLMLLSLLLGGLGGGVRMSLRPPYELVMEVISGSVIKNLDEIGIHDLRVEGTCLLEMAGVFLKKAGVDKAKAQELLGLIFDGQGVNKDEQATALAAEIVVGHVEPCSCGTHPAITLDELPTPEPAAEAHEAPPAEPAPMAG